MRRSNSIYGTVDLLILRTLSVSGPMHGLAIADEVHQVSDEQLMLDDSALSERGRRARFYDLTPSGRHHLKEAMEQWIRHADAINKVLRIAWSDAR